MIPAFPDDFNNLFVNVADDILSTLPVSLTDPAASLINHDDMLTYANFCSLELGGSERDNNYG